MPRNCKPPQCGYCNLATRTLRQTCLPAKPVAFFRISSATAASATHTQGTFCRLQDSGLFALTVCGMEDPGKTSSSSSATRKTGMGGISISTERPREWVTLDAPCATLELQYLQQPGGGSLQFSDNGGDPVEIQTDATDIGPAPSATFACPATTILK